MQTLPAVDFTSPTAAKSSHPELFWQRQPRAIGRSDCLARVVTDRLKLCIRAAVSYPASAAIDRTQNERVAAKLESVPTSR